MTTLTQEALQAERANLDAEWAKLHAERAAFEAERKESGVEVKLFVGNLDETSEEADIQTLFAPYGEIKEVVMLKGRDGKSKRSCFVKYYTKSAAEASVAALNGKHKDKDSTQMLVVRYAREKSAAPAAPAMQFAQYGQQFGMANVGYSNGYGGMKAVASGGGAAFGRGPPGANLYINNLSRQATEQDVQTMFGDFGRVVSVKLFSDAGYGFVSFDNTQSAQNAISCLNGLAVGDGSKRLEVSLKKEKGAGGTRFSPY